MPTGEADAVFTPGIDATAGTSGQNVAARRAGLTGIARRLSGARLEIKSPEPLASVPVLSIRCAECRMIII
jgi:hypothetical protein